MEDWGCCTKSNNNVIIEREENTRKKGYEKECAYRTFSSLQQGIQGTCQGFMPRWPQLSENPLLHSLKFQHVTLKYCLVIGVLLQTQVCVHCIYIDTDSHTPGKIILFPVHILSQNFACTSILLPKCSISIREGNGKFACTCTKAHIFTYKDTNMLKKLNKSNQCSS